MNSLRQHNIPFLIRRVSALGQRDQVVRCRWRRWAYSTDEWHRQDAACSTGGIFQADVAVDVEYGRGYTVARGWIGTWTVNHRRGKSRIRRENTRIKEIKLGGPTNKSLRDKPERKNSVWTPRTRWSSLGSSHCWARDTK